MKRLFYNLCLVFKIIKIAALLKIKSKVEKEIEKMQRNYIRHEFKKKLKKAEEKHNDYKI